MKKEKNKYMVKLTSTEVRLLRFALLQLRNRALSIGVRTDDLDALLLQI